MTDLFLDTSYVIALSLSHDHYHARALTLAENLTTDRNPLVTTRAITLEIGKYLSRVRHRNVAVNVLSSLESDPRVEIVPLSEDLYAEGMKLYSSRTDKNWSLSDCISFHPMRNRGIRDALTSDMHFEQAGFRPLLLH